MKAIYASKFYKASKRKDAIRSAIENPINHELVLQLREYIDDDSIPNTVNDESSKVKPSKKPDTTSDTSDSETATKSKFTSGGSIPRVPKADHHLSDMLKDEDNANSDIPQEVPSADIGDKPEPEEESVSESSDVSGTPVIASVDFSTQTDSIAGILNANSDTAGVRRCMVKPEDELWIYYNDSINLNNVMEPVISLLNASDYGHLDFNRLARTDNAIVFSISESPKPVEPVSDIDEG